jgi:hypothetical protein
VAVWACAHALTSSAPMIRYRFMFVSKKSGAYVDGCAPLL